MCGLTYTWIFIWFKKIVSYINGFDRILFLAFPSWGYEKKNREEGVQKLLHLIYRRWSHIAAS